MLSLKFMYHEIFAMFKSLVSSNQNIIKSSTALIPPDSQGIIECIISNKYCYSTEEYIKVIPFESNKSKQIVSKYNNIGHMFLDYPDLKVIVKNVFNNEVFSSLLNISSPHIILTKTDSNGLITDIILIPVSKFIELFIIHNHKSQIEELMNKIVAITFIGHTNDKKVNFSVELDDGENIPIQGFSSFSSVIKSIGIEKYPVTIFLTNELFKTNLITNSTIDNSNEIYSTFFRKDISNFINTKILF